MMKKRSYMRRSLTLVFIMMIVVTQSFTISANIKEIEDTEYTLTSVMVEADHDYYKKHDTQANYQETDTEGYEHSSELIQTAEWIDKEGGKAEFNIHYTAEFDLETETRSLYIFTTCTIHGFSMDIAINNILYLLESNDYIDVIMIGSTNSYVVFGDVTAASMFSIRAEDELSYSDIETILTTYTNDDFEAIDHAYALGSFDTDTSGSVDLLYNYTDKVFSDDYKRDDAAAIELMLTFGADRHCGGYFSLYYIEQYIGIIDDQGLDFSSTVQGIYNSFDGFVSPHRYTTYFLYDSEHQYPMVAEYTGLDMADEEMELASLMTKCQRAVETILEYDSNGRYIVLLPNETPNDDDGYKSYIIDSTWNTFVQTIDYNAVNEILYTMFLIDPIGTWHNEESVRSDIQEWLTASEGEGKTLTLSELGAYGYSEELVDLGLDVVSDQKEITITTTVHSDFIVDKEDIIVELEGTTVLAYNYTLDVEEVDGETIIAVTLTSIDDDGSSPAGISMLSTYSNICEVQIIIPATLDGDEFHDDGEFEQVKTEDTEVTVNRIVTLESGATQTYDETVSVEPTVLYKASTTDDTGSSGSANRPNRPTTTDEDSDVDEDRIVIIVETSTVGTTSTLPAWYTDLTSTLDPYISKRHH